MTTLEGAVVVVTGAGRGIGRAIAEEHQFVCRASGQLWSS
jgi:NADP-dependent 3-hydroxy acid dehydrogenase YdfG